MTHSHWPLKRTVNLVDNEKPLLLLSLLLTITTLDFLTVMNLNKNFITYVFLALLLILVSGQDYYDGFA